MSGLLGSLCSRSVPWLSVFSDTGGLEGAGQLSLRTTLFGLIFRLVPPDSPLRQFSQESSGQVRSSCQGVLSGGTGGQLVLFLVMPILIAWVGETLTLLRCNSPEYVSGHDGFLELKGGFRGGVSLGWRPPATPPPACHLWGEAGSKQVSAMNTTPIQLVAKCCEDVSPANGQGRIHPG